MTISDEGTYPYCTLLPNQQDSILMKEYWVPTKLHGNYNDDKTFILNFLNKCESCKEVLHRKLIMVTLFPLDRERMSLETLL